MKVLVQWARATLYDWEELDSDDWASTPTKPEPTDASVLDDLPGWVNVLNVQGVHLTGYDHYAVESTANRGCRVVVWNDDPDDQDLTKVRKWRPEQEPFTTGFYGQVWTFETLAPDPKIGNFYNTRQTMIYYAQGNMIQKLRSHGHTVQPWSRLPKPPAAAVRHGVWLTVPKMQEHLDVKSRQGWRHWTEGVPQEHLRSGRVRGRRD